MLEAWLLLLLRLCSVIRLSSSSSSMRNGCNEVGSSSGQEYCWRKGWDSAASAVSRSMGLKVKIRSRKSTAERRRRRSDPWGRKTKCWSHEKKKSSSVAELTPNLYAHFFIVQYLPPPTHLLLLHPILHCLTFLFFSVLNSLRSPWESISGSNSENGFLTLHPWLTYEGITWE